MNNKTIIIKGIPFSYMDEWGDPYVFNEATPQDLLAILKLASSLLENCGISYFLSYGTLLGAVRNGSLIKGDEDIDIIVTDEDRLFNSLPFLYENGLYINRIFKNELYSFHTDGRKGHLDIYIMKPIENWFYRSWCVSISGHYMPRKFFSGIDKDHYQIEGESYPCPVDSEGFLAWLYGKSWRIPQSKKGKTGVFPQRVVKFFPKYYGKLKRKVKRIITKTA